MWKHLLWHLSLPGTDTEASKCRSGCRTNYSSTCEKVVPTPVTKQETAPVAPAKPKQPALTETNSKLQENYVKLVKKTIEVCQDYELGIDIDDSIESLKEELQSQGISVTFDKEIMDVVSRLRSLQDKGIKVEKVLNLL